MKRLLLLAILLFPIITLVLWVCWGSSRPRPTSNQPTGNTNVTAMPAAH